LNVFFGANRAILNLQRCIGMYLTFQALLLCFFLAQMANGQDNYYAPIGRSFQPLAQKLAEQGTHFPGGSYCDHPLLVAVYRQLVIMSGTSKRRQPKYLA
jgi:hypothetical protein